MHGQTGGRKTKLALRVVVVKYGNLAAIKMVLYPKYLSNIGRGRSVCTLTQYTSVCHVCATPPSTNVRLNDWDKVMKCEAIICCLFVKLLKKPLVTHKTI